jgi:adenylate cyclase
MFLRLKTVRAKLTMLVALSIVMMLCTLPVLSWLLHRQLIDEVDDRVTEAERSFKSELADDLADLTLAARVLAADPDTGRALASTDEKEAVGLAKLFLGVYPNIDILFVNAQGKVLANVGCTSPLEQIKTVPGLADAIAGKEFRGVVAHGCERSEKGTPPAYVIGMPVKTDGAIVVCLPLDVELVQNASMKLGLELALIMPGDAAPVAYTERFPVRSLPSQLVADPVLAEEGGSWAIGRFDVDTLKTASGDGVDVSAALDVADIQKIVQRNLLFAILVLAVAAVISVTTGARLASIMSRALARVNVALKKLEQQEYVHVDAIATGDELEDLANGFNTMVDGLKERDKLRNTFGKYMTTAVMEHLLNGKVSLGGETLPVTILFTDIRSFTTISEKMDAQALVGLLNEYFTEMVGIVMQEDGVVDKYIGDAIMAVFGAPVPKPDDPANAVRAAVRMRHALRHLNERLKERGLAPLRTGIGIHTGEVVAGNIGSEARMEYTVIGDAVNLASRLESSTKELGVNILISEDTYQLVKDKVVARQVKEITVKGRAAPVMTYEVIGFEGEKNLEKDSDHPRTSSVPSEKRA